MAKDRKTVSIDMLLEYANGYLASDYLGGDTLTEKARRQGLIDMLETALNYANRYRGYSYLDETQITKSMPGIRWDTDPLDDRKARFANTDNTRRRYV